MAILLKCLRFASGSGSGFVNSFFSVQLPFTLNRLLYKFFSKFGSGLPLSNLRHSISFFQPKFDFFSGERKVNS